MENTNNRCGREVANDMVLAGTSPSDAWDIVALTHPLCGIDCDCMCPYTGQPCSDDA